MTNPTSNDLCRLLFETAADAILVLQDGQIVNFNSSATALLGRKKLAGKLLLDFAPPTQPDGSTSAQVWQDKFTAAAAGHPQHFEWVFQPTKKRTIYTEAALSILGFNGQTYTQLGLRDITERSEIESELRNSERRLTDIINFLPEGTFAIDLEGRLIAWNKAMEEMTGIKAKDVLGKGDYEYALPFYGERRPILANMAMQPSKEIAKNYPFIERDGENYLTEVYTPYFLREGGATVWAKACPLFDTDGNLAGAIESVRDITNRKEAEDELRNSERRLADIINFLPEGTFVIDLEGRLIAWNKAMEEMTGIKAKDVLGKGDYEYALPFYGERRPILANMAMQPSKEIARNYPFIERDGESYVTEVYTPYFLREGGATVWAKARPLYNAQGNMVGAIESVRDITERKLAEDALRESEEQFRLLSEQAMVGTIVLQDGRIRYANEAWAKIVEIPIEEMLQWAPNEFAAHVHPEDLPYLMEQAKRKQEGKGDINTSYEWRVISGSGQVKWVSMYSNTVPYEGGLANLATLIDITERMQTEQALKESEQRLSLHLKQTPLAYIEWNVGFHVIEWNPAAETIFGYTKAEALGRHAAGLIVPDEIKEIVDQVWADLLQQRGGTRSTNENITSDGRVIMCEWYNTPLVDEHNQVIGVSSLVQDITARVRLEEQVQGSLTRRERQVQISTQVSQEIASIVNEQDLYGRLVILIREQFGYYNVQLYQYNAQEKVLSIAAGVGRAGRQMLAENYQIAAGHSAAGVAAAGGASVLYSNVANRQSNPYLPDTQSEVAVPIKLGTESGQVQEAVLQYFVDDSRIEAMVVAAIDPVAAASITKQALQKNMPVIACTANLGSENQTSLVWAVEYDMGHKLGVQAGQWAAQHVPKRQPLKVGVLNYRIIPQVIERENGIIQGIKDVFGENVEIVGSETAVDSIQAFPFAERWLKEHPDLQMIVSINDAAALGAYRAVIAAGKNNPDHFFIGGIDATDEAIAALQSGGAYQATVDQSPAEMGVRAVRALVGALTGQPYSPTYELTCNPVDVTNVDDFITRKARGTVIDDADALTGVNLNGVKAGFSVMSLTNPFFVQLVEAARAEANRFGLELIVNEPKQVLGVLAVQSSQADGLDLEDQLTLEGLSGQIAVAIQKIRLLDEAIIFRQFAEATGQGFGIGSLEGKTAYMNPALLQALGETSFEDVVGKSIFDYFPESTQQILAAQILPTVMEEGQWVGETTIRTRSGKIFPAIQNIFLIHNEEGAPLYIANVLTDITERKQAEAELETRLQELNALQRLMSREGWKAYQLAQETGYQGYLFDELSVQPVETIENGHPAQTTASGNGHSLSRPVSIRGEVVGTLGVFDKPEHPLDPEDREFLDSVAEQVAEALERARLLEQTQKRAVELEAVAQVGTVAATVLDVNDLLQTVVDLTKTSFKLYHAHIYLVDEADGALNLAAGAGTVGRKMVEQGWQISMGHTESIVVQAFKTRQGIISNNVQESPTYLPNPLLPETLSELAVPLLAGKNVLGVLDVQANFVNRFTKDDVRIQTTLAAQVAVALQNASQYQQTQAALKETGVLYQIAQSLGQAGNQQEMFELVLPEYLRFLDLPQGGVLIFDEDMVNGTLEALVVDGKLAEAGLRIPVETNPACRQLIETKEAVIVSDALNDRLLEPVREFVMGMGYKSILLVPIIVRGKVVGALGADSTEIIRQFTGKEVALIQAIADQLGIAIQSQRLFAETEAALAEVEATQRRYTVQSWETYRARTPLKHFEHARDGKAPAQEKLPAGVDEAVTEKQPVVVSAAPVEHPENAPADQSGAPPAGQSNIIVPLTVRDEVIGVLGLQDTDTRNWTPEEVALVQAVAEQMAQAAENLRLLDETQQRAARERRVNEISEKIQASQSLEEALQIAVKEVGLSLQSPHTAVKLAAK